MDDLQMLAATPLRLVGSGPWKLVRFATKGGALGGIVCVPQIDWHALSDASHVIGMIQPPAELG